MKEYFCYGMVVLAIIAGAVECCSTYRRMGCGVEYVPLSSIEYQTNDEEKQVYGSLRVPPKCVYCGNAYYLRISGSARLDDGTWVDLWTCPTCGFVTTMAKELKRDDP